MPKFNSVDPVSENFESWTTYHYSYNNPINLNDPMGDAANLGSTYQLPNMRDLIERVMASYGWGSYNDDGNGGGGGGRDGVGGGGGTYADFKARLDYLGSDAWKAEMEAKDKSDYFSDLMAKWKKQGFAEAGRYWYSNGEGHFDGPSNGGSNIFVLIVDAMVNGWRDMGHTAVQIGNSVYGYYPTGSIVNSQGVMRVNTREEFDEHYLTEGYTEFTLNITVDQKNKVEENLEGYIDNPGAYSMFNRQCTNVSCGALLDAGVILKTDIRFATFRVTTPSTFPEEFRSLLSHWANRSLVIGKQYFKKNN